MNILASQQQHQPDSHLSRFYEKLAEIRHQWIPLEDVHYRLTEFGSSFELDKARKDVQKWPEFDYFHIAIAKNGGPIAMMLKDKTLFIGQKEKEIKSLIFVFSSFGKFISVIDLPKKFEVAKEKLMWGFLGFTPDNEDLVLVSADGTLYLIDPLTGENREDPVNLGAEFA
jgi:hypothetical protein